MRAYPESRPLSGALVKAGRDGRPVTWTVEWAAPNELLANERRE
jgi:hypothetical protein